MMMQDILMKGSTPVQNMRTEVNLNTRTLQVNLKTENLKNFTSELEDQGHENSKSEFENSKMGK